MTLSEESYRKIHYPVYGKHTIGDALKCQKCSSPIVWVFNSRPIMYGKSLTDNKICLCNEKEKEKI